MAGQLEKHDVGELPWSKPLNKLLRNKIMTNEQTLGKPFRLEVAADRLSVSYKTAWRLVRDGALGAFKSSGPLVPPRLRP